MNLRHVFHGLCCASVLICVAAPARVEAQTQETTEVAFSSPDARWLKAKADELKTPVAIYEYLRNSVEYQPYWGSWSGSVNTFSALRGNDIDIASTLLAMLRSQGIPARYAVGTIRIPSQEVTNWLGVGTHQVAMTYLKNAGTPDAAVHASLANTVVLEHVWVEALVPFDQYRGLPLETNGVNCQSTPTQCHWVSLDASFKQRRYGGKGLNPYASVKWDDTDYNLYFNAIKNDDKARRDKSVIHILEQDVLAWLRASTTNNGLTLDDVDDRGEIIPVLEGLLPASLPYQLNSSNVRRYNTMADHDAAETSKPWNRKLKITVYPCHPDNYTGSPSTSTYDISLPDVATDRLVISNATAANGSVDLNLKRGRGATTTTAKTWNFGNSVSCKDWQGNVGAATPFTTNSSFWVKLETDLEPGLSAAPPAIHAATVGGRVLVAAGGETSNWGQVHRAAATLLEASRTYNIVYNASQPLAGQACAPTTGSGCIPFVDTGPVGWDASDVKLVNNPSAVQDLQGGLLEVAAAQYFAETREQYKRADGLLRMVTPLRRFVGLVKSDYDVQYLKDGTAFSIQPNGLVIDMSYLVGEPVQRSSTAPTADIDHMYFLTFIGSSLEHEVWQKLTGFDAMSTVRSIQVAVNANQAIKTYKGGISGTGISGAAQLFIDMGFTNEDMNNPSRECTGRIYLNLSEYKYYCRNISDNNLPTKYSAGMIDSIARQLLGGADIQLTAQPATGTGYKSQVFIKKETSSGGASVTFAINVTGTP